MKKVIAGLAAIGAVIALRSVVKRKAKKMREHCEQMAVKCKQMMAQSELGGEGGGMREHCKEMAAQHKEDMERSGMRDDGIGDRERSEPTAVS